MESTSVAQPNEKLAQSLRVLSAIQARAGNAIEIAANPELTRTHRERLRRSGFLAPIINGWDMVTRAEDRSGDSTAWYASMEVFVAAYATSRFGDEWQATPEFSLLRHSGYTGILPQIVLHAPAANNQVLGLPHACSLVLARCAPATLVPDAVVSSAGLRLIPVYRSLVTASPTFFEKHPDSAQICLRIVDATDMTRVLLEGGQTVVAGRMAGALRAVGRWHEADQLLATMRAAGYRSQETNPFVAPVREILGARAESPYVQRLRLMWSGWRETVVEAFQGVPRARVADVPAWIADIEARYTADAYNSLSIEGYQVTEDLIERVSAGQWNPDDDPSDKDTVNAMAAKGYFELHKRVVDLIRRSFGAGQSSRGLFQGDFDQWYVTLFSPSVQAGILKPADLAGYRNRPIFIRNARHVPPSPEAVRDCMPALIELIVEEPEPSVRAVLGHFAFVFIHPYVDGNGRIGRFLMNYMLTTAGHHWTIVEVERRGAYMAALEQASSYGNIKPFADLVANFAFEQAKRTPARKPQPATPNAQRLKGL
jgi:hypothetical protein